MKILFEEYHYKTALLEEILSERYYLPVDIERSKIIYVGYYFNSKINEAVFVFPKVFIYNGEKAFGEFLPEEIINCDAETMGKLKAKGKGEVIYELSIWMYQTMLRFKKRHEKSAISNNESVANVISNLDDSVKTELDIVLSLIKFHKENKHLFTQIAQLSHSQKRRVDWSKTISKKTGIITKQGPVYMDVISKSKKINFDEELIVIFYSVLKHLNRKYSFRVILNENYELIENNDFKRLLKKGAKKLKSIRRNYYSDKFIILWNLLYTFFEHSEKVLSGKKLEEVLMVKDFNIVFEDMIDDLIGDTEIPRQLKYQKDGKQIDHIYNYNSLIDNDNIYYIGDSKYYKTGNSIGGHAIAKQYTYAKNVIQYSIDLFNRNELDNNIRYRDDLTEGYNITPNFFISAFINDDYSFANDGLEEAQTCPLNYHFKDRIFDRDTLFLQSYNINFLFVLATYISRSSSQRNQFRDKTHSLFRQKMIDHLNNEYKFYTLEPDNITDFVTKHFRLLNGKMYRPSQMDNSLIIGIPKGKEGNIWTELGDDLVSVQLTLR